jgi:hypothetical protein
MKKNKKYELVEDDFILHKGKKLYRIRALKPIFSDSRINIHRIRQGSLGGYVEGYHNLSQECSCWISDNAKVYENARVEGSAMIYGCAEIFGNAVVNGSAKIMGDAELYVYGNTVIST